MTTYISFLIFTFVMGRVAPKTFSRPVVLLGMCALFAVSIYGSGFPG